MTQPRPLPPEFASGPFSTRDAIARGVTGRRLRAQDLEKPFTGVRSVRVDGPDWPRERAVSRARAFVPLLRPGQFFSELTAVAIHNLPVPSGRSADTDTHVGVLYPLTAPVGRGVTGHQHRSVRIENIEGMPVASPVDAWLQCAARSSITDLIVVGDGLVRRQFPLATLSELHTAAERFHGRGALALRGATTLIRERTDSPRESLIRLAIVRAGLPEPDVNVPIFNRFGAQIALADMAYPAFRVIVEYDGRQHFDDEKQHHRDVDRLDAIMEESWRVIRINRSHLARGASAFVPRIETALLDRGWRRR